MGSYRQIRDRLDEPKQTMKQLIPQVSKDLVVQILEIMEADDECSVYGLRRLHSDESNQVGSKLAQSRVWDDGEITDEQLDGTCAIAINGYDSASIEVALRHITNYWFCDIESNDCNRIALIKGTSEGGHHTLEAHATIIRYAEIVMTWTENNIALQNIARDRY